jgi:hypothetical protein
MPDSSISSLDPRKKITFRETSPHKPPLAFRVGIVGHRPNRLQNADLEQLGTVIKGILQLVDAAVKEASVSCRELFAPGAPEFRAVSPLAEGSDRLFAEQALALGWNLCCVMPFPREEYEKDFIGENALEANSLDRFRGFLDPYGSAEQPVCLELDGSRSDETGAYGICGTVVVGLSDLLIAVWDGDKERDKQGGTRGTMIEAQSAGVPVVWVDGCSPHAWRLMGSTDQEPGTVRSAVYDALSLPETTDHEEIPSGHRKQSSPTQSLYKYYAEVRPRCNPWILWKTFRNVLGDLRFTLATWEVKSFEEDSLDEWPADETSSAAALVNRLRPFYSWPDKLADLHADRYRSSFIACYMFAAFSVGLALLPVAIGPVGWEPWCYVLELSCIAIVLTLYLVARSSRWHECWLDYRLAAELTRHLRIVAPICGKPPLPPVPAYHAMHDLPQATWMNWHLRAITRAIGLTNTKLDHRYLCERLQELREFLDGQVKFHIKSEHRSKAIESRLHRAIAILLGLTVLACLLHLAHAPVPGHLLLFFCGFFPALGGSLAAINNHGEFRRVGRRSHAMHYSISALIERIDALIHQMTADGATGSAFFPKVRELTEYAADQLVREVLDWRVLLLDRPPELAP